MNMSAKPHFLGAPFDWTHSEKLNTQRLHIRHMLTTLFHYNDPHTSKKQNQHEMKITAFLLEEQDDHIRTAKNSSLMAFLWESTVSCHNMEHRYVCMHTCKSGEHLPLFAEEPSTPSYVLPASVY